MVKYATRNSCDQDVLISMGSEIWKNLLLQVCAYIVEVCQQVTPSIGERGNLKTDKIFYPSGEV